MEAPCSSTVFTQNDTPVVQATLHCITVELCDMMLLPVHFCVIAFIVKLYFIGRKLDETKLLQKDFHWIFCISLPSLTACM